VAKIAHLASLVESDERFELWGVPTSGVLVWRPRREPAAEVRARLCGAWVSLTIIDGETWFRSVGANPQADPALVFRSVVDALADL